MNRVSARASIALFVLCASLAAGAAAKEVPYLTGRVNDYGNILSPDAEARIASELERLESETGTQIAVLTIQSLEGDSLEDFSMRVATTWKLGRGEFDDGALLLIAKAERKTRIEVGYGLEPSLTDAKSRRILDEIMRPRFRDGDFDGGVEAAVDAMIDVAKGAELPPPSPSYDDGGGGDDFFGIVWFVLLSPFIWMTIRLGPLGWFLYLFLVPFFYAGGAAFGGHRLGVILAVAWLVIVPILWFLTRNKREKWRKAMNKRSKWSSDHGWGSGGWSSGGGSSGGGWSGGGGGWSGGGGFSGGGGSFGGGGSSSGW